MQSPRSARPAAAAAAWRWSARSGGTTTSRCLLGVWLFFCKGVCERGRRKNGDDGGRGGGGAPSDTRTAAAANDISSKMQHPPQITHAPALRLLTGPTKAVSYCSVAFLHCGNIARICCSVAPAAVVTTTCDCTMPMHASSRPIGRGACVARVLELLGCAAEGAASREGAGERQKRAQDAVRGAPTRCVINTHMPSPAAGQPWRLGDAR